MTAILINRIVSVSSEDLGYPAKNLLNQTSDRKEWKCKSAGEKQAFVVFQLSKPVNIDAIDIGNANSAFIEILVGISSSHDKGLKVLLVSSSFMTPKESKKSVNTNGVRSFKKADFSEPVRDGKWDYLKVVCTQPFNKDVQFGLSFITLHHASSQNGDSTEAPSAPLGEKKGTIKRTKSPTQVKERYKIVGNRKKTNCSKSDSDSEVPSLDTKKAKNNKPLKVKDKQDLYNADTDDSEEDTSGSIREGRKDTSHLLLPPLLDIFSGMSFSLGPDLGLEQRTKLRRYIIAYKGYMAVKVEHAKCIITRDKNQMNSLDPEAQCLSPDWVWACSLHSKIVPTSQFEIADKLEG